MPSSTISCQIVVSVNDYSVRQCIVTLGTASDIACCIPSNVNCVFNLADINLLGQLATERMCIAHSYEYSNLLCVCPAPSSTFSSDIGCFAKIYSDTHMGVCQVDVNGTIGSERTCIVPVHEYVDTSCIAVAQDSASSSIICHLPIAAETMLSVADIDVSFSSSDSVVCTVTGELYSDLACSIVTNTKVSDLLCGLHGVADVDSYSDRACVVYRQAGEPVDYVALEVVLADRAISTIRCIAEVPPNNYYDLMCSTSYVVSGRPRWNRFSTDEWVVVRVMDLGDIEVSRAVLQDVDTTEEAVELGRVNNVWQIKFRLAEYSDNYVIVLTLSNGKVVVVDRSKSQFSL